MEIILNSKILLENELTISEYLYLKSLYEENNDPTLFKIIDKVNEDDLQQRGFLKITTQNLVLRNKAIELFEGKDLFLKFLSSFPIKTPSGRYLSPLGNSGIVVGKIKKKWNTLFKNKPHIQEKVLNVLYAELEWRKKTNQLEFIHNIETWLNQGDYEKFEYLLEEKKEKDGHKYNDFM